MKDNSQYCIYRIVCSATGRVYVGQTVHFVTRRRAHINALKSNRHSSKKLQRAFDKYGLVAFYFEVIEVELSFNEANEREIFWIQYYEAHTKGFNSTSGGRFTNTRGKPVEWNGVKYASCVEAARCNGVTFATMRSRLSKGLTCDAEANPLRRKCRWNGVEYTSLKEAADALGIKPGTLLARLKSGANSDKDLVGGGTKQRKSCTWNGMRYESVTSAAKALGVSVFTMHYRYRKGYSCDGDLLDGRFKSKTR